MPLTNPYKKNICILDAEYNTPEYRQQFNAEVLSIGAVICDTSGEILDTFYRIIFTKHPMSQRIQELTKLNDKLVQQKGVTYTAAMRELLALFTQYGIKHTLVWGHDRQVLKHDLNGNRTNVSKSLKQQIQHQFVESIADVSKTISKQFSASTLSMDSMKWLCGVDGAIHHMALADALDLHGIIKTLWSADIPEYRKTVLQLYQNNRTIYHDARRFRNKTSSLLANENQNTIRQIQKQATLLSQQLCELANPITHPDLYALKHDLQTVSDETNVVKDFPTIQHFEYLYHQM